MTDIEAFEAEVEHLLAEKIEKEQAVYVPPAETALEIPKPQQIAAPAWQSRPEERWKSRRKNARPAHQTIRVHIERLDLWKA